MAVVQLLGPEQPRIDGLPETIETIAAQLSQYADRKQSDATAARMKDQFVSTVSHELRTPLAAMDGWLHILLDGEPGPLNEEQHRFLTTVKRNSDRLMRLVGDLLLIGQMDAGRFTLDLTNVDVSELVSETVALFEGTATEKRIELTADMAPGAMVRGDRLRLGQLLSNLVSNAVKFTPEGGQVRVRVGEQGGTCVVEVTDSGIGIPAEERSHLFERFYRASTATGTAGSAREMSRPSRSSGSRVVCIGRRRHRRPFPYPNELAESGRRRRRLDRGRDDPPERGGRIRCFSCSPRCLAEQTLQVDRCCAKSRGSEAGLEIGKALLVVLIAQS